MKVNELIKVSASIMMILCISVSARAEHVFLKDGSILEGSIERDNPASISLRLRDGRTQIIERSNIMRILYTETYMGKIHLQKIDGTSLEGYIVDEDQQTFTIRKDIKRPEEFTIKREEILFTTRKNPVALTGRPGLDSIDLSWKPPYAPPRSYKVYIRAGKDYSLAGTCGGTSFRVKGLSGNRRYYLKVTAIDPEGIESLPSNEITVTTLHHDPEPPRGLTCERLPGSAKGAYTARLTWKPGVSPDGKVKEYRILRKEGRKYSAIGTSGGTGFEIKNIPLTEVGHFAVRTIDENGWESAESRLVNTFPLDLFTGFEAGYIFPLGKMKDMHSGGYGGLFHVRKSGLFSDSLEAGISAGYWRLTGSGDVDSSTMIPLLAALRCRIGFGPFFIVPGISAGMSFNSIDYQAYADPNPVKTGRKRSSLEPLVTGGLSLRYEISDRFSVFAGADAAAVIESGDIFPFISFNAGMLARF
jgi:hypothetical protein